MVRRDKLTSLALAECIEYKGRFLDPLLDVIWAMCEQSTGSSLLIVLIWPTWTTRWWTSAQP